MVDAVGTNGTERRLSGCEDERKSRSPSGGCEEVTVSMVFGFAGIQVMNPQRLLASTARLTVSAPQRSPQRLAVESSKAALM